MTVAELYELAITNAWQRKVRYYLVEAAVAIKAEPANTPSHAERVVFADKVLSGAAPVETVALAVLTNPTIAAEAPNVPDGDVQFAVQSVVNAFAVSV